MKKIRSREIKRRRRHTDDPKWPQGCAERKNSSLAIPQNQIPVNPKRRGRNPPLPLQLYPIQAGIISTYAFSTVKPLIEAQQIEPIAPQFLPFPERRTAVVRPTNRATTSDWENLAIPPPTKTDVFYHYPAKDRPPVRANWVLL